jgi:hypothetical protein
VSFPEENTLGVIPGRDGRRRVPEATRRAIRAGASHRASLGTAFIGVGAAVVFGLRSVYGLSWLVGLWGAYPNPFAALAAWAVLIGVVIATVLVARSFGDQLPDWMFVIFLAGIAGAVALDLWAIWPLHDVGRYATAAVASGMALIVVVTVRRARDVLIATGVLAVVLGAAIALGSEITADTIAQQFTTFAFAVLPPVIGVVIVDGFRGLVRRELDRVLVQSTVSAPRFAVGMLASEELARLDLAAEDLLESVASGRTQLPLDPRTASVAASLATELRLHLIEGRRETWLYHAVTESDLLGKAVTLADTGSLAGLLDPGQRDGLLSAVWLLVVGDGKGGSRELKLTVGPATQSVETPDGRRIMVPIDITLPRTSRNRVDSGVWGAVQRVGQYSDSIGNSDLHITVQCLVENPADQAQSHSRAQGERS